MIEQDPVATGIEGSWLLPLRVIDTPGGAVLHMLRPIFPLQPGLPAGECASGDVIRAGEIYFSEVLPGAVKAWKRHTRQVQHFAVPAGRLGIALYDARPQSPTRGDVRHFVLGRRDTYALLRIPTGVWYGFTALGGSAAMICNCADIPHDPAEGEKCLYDSPEAAAFPFSWKEGFPDS